MLYPKREKPLTAQEFKNPSSEYRGTPFWAWNTKLDRDELVWQIEQLKKMGFGGFHMHVRTGMATPYLSDEYMDIVGACVEKARREQMLAWLYDEDRWPSGAAGGLVTKNEQYRIRYLRLTRHPKKDGALIACFDVSLDEAGDLEGYRRIKAEDSADESAAGIKLYAYAEQPQSDPWYNNQTYINTLDPKAIAEFIRITYNRYEKRFAGDFGALIPAIFTDEPQFSRKGTLGFARDDRDVTLPWTDDIGETFKAAYNGESLIDGIPELLWDFPRNRPSPLRYHYHDHIAERFAQAFADQCGAWCAAHGLMLTGHMMEEPTLKSQTHALGEAMRSYRSFQLPGIDMLCDRREFTTAKQTQSAVHQYGYPGMLSELYGVTNWDFDFRGHKLQGDWQACLGVTVRVPHLSWVSMNGEAKRDYPGTFNYQAPWYEQYSYIEDHFARIASALTRGKAVVRVGVLHPIESYWLHWGPQEKTETIREQMDRNFQDLCDWLLKGLIDFDYICESTLPSLCDPAEIKSGASFPVGKMNYEVIIVPGMETMRETTLRRIEAFRNAGGRVIFLGDAPKYLDAKQNDGGLKLWERSERLGFERLAVLGALDTVRELDIRDDSGVETQNLIYQLREEAGGVRWLFIAHADKPVNPDLPAGDLLHIRIRGIWAVTRYDTISGDISPLPVEQEQGNTVIIYPFYEHDSLLVRLDKGTPTIAAERPKLLTNAASYIAARPSDEEPPYTSFTGPVPVTLHEPNVLLLDMAEYALDKGAWRPREEILRLDKVVRIELGWPIRKKAVAQPWVARDTTTPNTLRLRYTFGSELAISGAELALENAANTTVTLNGEAAGPAAGWYVDHCIGRVKLPPIKEGSNSLELSIPYGPGVNIEALYLLGDFGVEVRGTVSTLTKPVRTLAFGDITRQGLPFYGGNITYHLEAESRGGALTVAATCYRGHLLRVAVDGEDKGVIAYSPYRLTLKGLADGKLHKVDVVYFGNRINTFGQLHANNRDRAYWDPNSWRSIGPAWTYEYGFWPQGILKSPELS
ncbi:hypothetical protein FACS1894110_11210 [Spirochaetia bacterium]|nr:hypothetical protein FACS1894110_11210 [Spirochaetia bacterium]